MKKGGREGVGGKEWGEREGRREGGMISERRVERIERNRERGKIRTTHTSHKVHVH